MTLAERATLLRRHELTRAIALVDGGRGWRMTYLSAYTAAATFRHGDRVTAHVIGCASGWFWSLQLQPCRVGPAVVAVGPVEACWAGHRAAMVAWGAIGRA